MQHLVTIDSANHKFLNYDSWINCAKLLPLRQRQADQHIREKPKEEKGKLLSAEVRAKVLCIVQDSKLLTPDEKAAIKAALA